MPLNEAIEMLRLHCAVLSMTNVFQPNYQLYKI